MHQPISSQFYLFISPEKPQTFANIALKSINTLSDFLTYLS